ncbi:MAG: hypothetical protein F6K47_09985 [Symploca sp. SIO2E6]|nr:hypothetical protein [Symploca sp. SIO2E6]
MAIREKKPLDTKPQSFAASSPLNASSANAVTSFNRSSSTQPDLVVQSQSAPTSAKAGSRIRLTGYVKNQGSSTATSSYLKYYLSTDTSLSSNDTYLGQDYVRRLRSGRSSYESHYARLSSNLQSGNYYLLWKADATGRVAEGNESNNVGYRSINITGNSGTSTPDLVVQSQSAPTSAQAGSRIRLSGYVKNQGSATATSSYLKYYLSTDTSLSSSDTYLGQDYVRRLRSGRSSYESHYARLSSSLQSGNYYLLWQADSTGRVAEGNESNNVGYRSINITDAPKPDLVVQSQSAPTSAQAGSTIRLTGYVKNQGSATATSSYLKYYLSTDTSLSSNDTYLGQDYVRRLSSGRSSYESHYAKLSSTLRSGNYYLLWQADSTGRVTEGNESNNVGYRSINITGAPQPDLIIQNQSAASSVTAGSTLNITYSLKNQGNANASGNYTKFYLSTDATYSSNDIELGSDDISSLSAGSTLNRSKSLSISSSITAGNYYLLWRADANSNVSESNENNNVVSKYITVNSAQPDLIIQNQSAASSVTAGSTLNITYSLKNQGNANASANYTKFYLSTDATYSSNDIELGDDYISSISTGSTLNRSKSLSISSSITAGNYYLIWRADANGSVSESNESNNVAYRTITITSPTITDPTVSYGTTSGNQGIDALLPSYVPYWNTSNNGGVITYSFLSNSAASSYYGSQQVSEVSNAVKINVRNIFNSLTSFLDVSFVEVADTASSYGVLRYMYSSGPSYAYAYYPSSSALGGDIHLNEDYESDSYNAFSGDPGKHGYMTLIHETFHALGLKHPGNYNGSGTGSGPFLPGGEDNTTNTVMTYNFAGNSAVTAMPYDIRALQYLYGAKNHNDSTTTYAFSSVYGYSVGGDFFGSNSSARKQTLWDSNGIDTLDFSNLAINTSYRFDINQGGMITTQSAYNGTSYTARGEGGTYTTSTYGTAIAYNTVIENLLASKASDYIIANDAANTFSGYTLGTHTGSDIYESTSSSDVLNLSSYSLSDIAANISGSNVTFSLGSGSYGSIQVKDYYGAKGSMKFLIGGNYYTYSSSGNWQLTSAPATIATSNHNTSNTTQGLTATNLGNTNSSHQDTLIAARCECAVCSAVPKGLNLLGNTSLAEVIGV